MKTQRVVGIAVIILIAGHTLAQPGETPGLAKDAKIQDLINRAMGKAIGGGDIDKEAFKKIEELARNAPEKLIPQVVLYGATGKEKDSWNAIITMRFLRPFEEHAFRVALAPLLDSDDKHVRELAKIWLLNVDGFVNRDALSHYPPILEKNLKAPPAGLVDYLFEHDPSNTLLEYSKFSSKDRRPDRALMWSDHLIKTAQWRYKGFLQPGDLEKAQKEMDAMSKHESWYVRRYVAEMMWSRPELGTPEIRDRLQKDADPLVAKRAQEIKVR